MSCNATLRIDESRNMANPTNQKPGSGSRNMTSPGRYEVWCISSQDNMYLNMPMMDRTASSSTLAQQ
ncbi:hypothetical protein TNCV_250131 [Trichonephila clavipes]|nr:hypothetical protein TNCV_250131 [Trichonephila clavipes]